MHWPRASPAPDTLHATPVAASGALGVLALAGAVIGLGRGCIDLTRVATQGSLRGFLAPSLAVAELLAWAGRHGGWLGRPRADGRPG